MAAPAQSPAATPSDWPSFRQTDADKSGAISMDEARRVQGLGDRFADYDRNTDGQLSRSEFEAAKRTSANRGATHGATEQSR
ncbi:MAG TPA: hypothetical protein VF203_13730 [Burkholderiales bacterium]